MTKKYVTKQLSLFSKEELKALGRRVKTDLTSKQLTDKEIDLLLPKLQLVSSKQLARILSKKNDNSLRAQRCQNTGYNFYKDKFGNVYYNLPEVMKEMAVSFVE